MKKPRILAIDGGSRTLGIAVIDGEELVLHDVLVVADRKSPSAILACVRKALTDLIRRYEPDLLALERTYFGRFQRTAILHVVSGEIVALARRQRLPVVLVSPLSARKALTGRGHATKHEVAAALAVRYPTLRPYLRRQSAARRLFDLNRTDALAVGLYASRCTDRIAR